MFKLINNDCFIEFKKMQKDSIDVTFTSPPYNSVRHKKYKNYNDNLIDYYEFLCKFTDELLRITKKYIIINLQTNYYNREDVYKYIGQYYNKISRIIIWNKSNPTPSSMQHKLTNSYEFFIIFSKLKSITINSIFMKDVINFPINSVRIKNHKAIMNNDIADLFIKEFSNRNDTILDCFMGTGTTGLSCKKYERNFIGIEIDKEYFEIAKERIDNCKKQIDLLEILGDKENE